MGMFLNLKKLDAISIRIINAEDAVLILIWPQEKKNKAVFQEMAKVQFKYGVFSAKLTAYCLSFFTAHAEICRTEAYMGKDNHNLIRYDD